MQVLDDNWTLKVRGALVDKIEHMSDVQFNSIITYNHRGGIKNFLASFVPNIKLIFDNRQPRHGTDDDSVDLIFQEAFEALTQPPASDSTPSHVEETITIWRAGFRRLLKFLFASQSNSTDVLNDRFWTNADEGHPELRMFLDRVSHIAAGRRICVTKHGMIGLVPDTSVKGDRIAYFDGCGNPFILHPTENSRCDDMDSPNKSHCVYSLVGATHFPASLLTLDSPDVVHDDIFLV
jgi:hypothetical protein